MEHHHKEPHKEEQHLHNKEEHLNKEDHKNKEEHKDPELAKESINNTLRDTTHNLQEAAAHAKGHMKDVADKIIEKIHEGTTKTGDAIARGQGKAGDVADKSKELGAEAKDQLKEKIHEGTGKAKEGAATAKGKAGDVADRSQEMWENTKEHLAPGIIEKLKILRMSAGEGKHAVEEQGKQIKDATKEKVVAAGEQAGGKLEQEKEQAQAQAGHAKGTIGLIFDKVKETITSIGKPKEPAQQVQDPTKEHGKSDVSEQVGCISNQLQEEIEKSKKTFSQVAEKFFHKSHEVGEAAETKSQHARKDSGETMKDTKDRETAEGQTNAGKDGESQQTHQPHHHQQCQTHQSHHQLHPHSQHS